MPRQRPHLARFTLHRLNLYFLNLYFLNFCFRCGWGLLSDMAARIGAAWRRAACVIAASVIAASAMMTGLSLCAHPALADTDQQHSDLGADNLRMVADPRLSFMTLNAGDYEKAYAIWWSATKAGDQKTLWLMGEVRHQSDSASHDYKRVFSYYKHSADLGFVSPQNNSTELHCNDLEPELTEMLVSEYLELVAIRDDSEFKLDYAGMLLAMEDSDAYPEAIAILQELIQADTMTKEKPDVVPRSNCDFARADTGRHNDKGKAGCRFREKYRWYSVILARSLL